MLLILTNHANVFPDACNRESTRMNANSMTGLFASIGGYRIDHLRLDRSGMYSPFRDRGGDIPLTVRLTRPAA